MDEKIAFEYGVSGRKIYSPKYTHLALFQASKAYVGKR